MLIPSSAKIWFDLVHHAGLVAVNVQQAAEPCGGQGRPGKLTAERVEPLSEHLTSLLATSRPMFSWASGLEPPMWGSGSRCPGAAGENSSLLDLGSTGEDVDGGAGEVAALDDVGQGVDVHHGAAGGVDEDGARFHHANCLHR